MRKAYSPGKPSELKIISILKNNKDLKPGISLSKYISSKTTNRNNNTKYNLKERPASHKTINSLLSKKAKPLIQKQQYQYQHQPISVKNNNNEINIHLSFGSDSINNNTNSYSNNANYSKVTNSYEDILKEKDMVILKLENELLFNRELINKIQSNYNINSNNNYTSNNNFISLSKTKSSGNITTKTLNSNSWYENVVFLPSASYVTIKNNSSQAISFFKGSDPMQTSTGSKLIAADGGEKTFQINMGLLSGDQKNNPIFKAFSNEIGYAIGNAMSDKYYIINGSTQRPAEGFDFYAGKRYYVKVSGGDNMVFTVDTSWIDTSEDVTF